MVVVVLVLVLVVHVVVVVIAVVDPRNLTLKGPYHNELSFYMLKY